MVDETTGEAKRTVACLREQLEGSCRVWCFGGRYHVAEIAPEVRDSRDFGTRCFAELPSISGIETPSLECKGGRTLNDRAADQPECETVTRRDRSARLSGTKYREHVSKSHNVDFWDLGALRFNVQNLGKLGKFPGASRSQSSYWIKMETKWGTIISHLAGTTPGFHVYGCVPSQQVSTRNCTYGEY